MRQDPNNYWEQLERLEKLIRASELKAGIIFSFHSLIIGLFIDRIEQFQPVIETSKVFVVLSFLWIGSVLVSIYYCFKCFKPQLELKYDKNVFFFRDAVYGFGDAKEYTKKLMEVCNSEHEMFEQLSQQIHIESKIIDQKFICVQKSIKFFGLSFIFVIMALAFWLVTV
ncbi:Pycsar system effector family protein [Lutimonas zeaxanthinifaciens]|uniref:Pycsar system effector family protein n=1 Tax=Lutimonas zeaxanthinifaciens TaxID=3060215 RepID=UPI001EAA8573|nr:Pycsar system effector family protein [Lutimonas sp. YSD2104]UCE94098.1 MAG: hypothetical protein JSV73_02100 [Flavobacteriaceae bacterium]WKK65666.1 DUF5706 domain-containing protein [Lutimonas sp. YSD2104]